MFLLSLFGQGQKLHVDDFGGHENVQRFVSLTGSRFFSGVLSDVASVSVPLTWPLPLPRTFPVMSILAHSVRHLLQDECKEYLHKPRRMEYDERLDDQVKPKNKEGDPPLKRSRIVQVHITFLFIFLFTIMIFIV